ncbi:UBC-like protein [Coniochaeta ligniaria NRRL 30616]|uniref:UBC-like protein n=1 Tax=Coniochaeta ligniaria NRRL 30616 TaxID=1408157 RepID=A0A1J7IQ02_9PEZI|nr:UBC-like protein [Coniochaeta ligniaria NRRL 30616]
MATPKFNSKSPTIRRIMREAAEMSQSPSPDYVATPLETDLFEWHFTLRGPPNSPYGEGIYHGRIVLPPTYPLRPPSFRFSTPSGRFEANREICLSISGHHEETWQPAWGVRTALVALRSFMETDAKGQLGGLDTSDAVRKRLASESGGWKCGVCNGGKTNREIMAEQEEVVRLLDEEEEKVAGEKKRREEVEVPAELKMGFRDEMEKAAAAAKTPEGEVAGGRMDEESAQLAEGFVQTAPVVEGQTGRVDTASLPARPAQTVPQPTKTVPLPAGQQVVGVPQVQLQQRRANDGVPMWIDRLIVLLGVLLAAMVLKVFLGA